MIEVWRLRVYLLLAIAVVVLPPQAHAQDTTASLRLVGQGQTVRFGESIDFLIDVTGQGPLRALDLFYRRDGEGVTVRQQVSPEPGVFRYEHTWALEPGEVPVGEIIEFRWRVTDVDGNVLETPWDAFAYEDDRFSWQVLSAGKLALHWYGITESDARRLLQMAVDDLGTLQDEVGVSVTEVVHIYVYRSKSDMALALPRRSDAYDDRILTLGVVVDDTTLLLLGSHADVEHTLAHELSHVVVGLAAEGPYSSVPRWLDEGLAMYAEGALGAVNQRALDRAIRDDSLISVRSLSGYSGDPEQVDLFYGEVYSLVDFMLRTYGREKMGHFVARIRDGLYQEEALRQVYDLNLDELDERWRESLGLAAREARTPAPAAGGSQGFPREGEPWRYCSSALAAAVGILTAVIGRLRAGAS